MEYIMNIRILGASGPYPAAGAATSGYLVESGDTRVLVDCGSGVVSELLSHVQATDLTAVVITHHHHDHVADLGILSYKLLIDQRLGKRTEPLPLYVYEKSLDYLKKWIGGNDFTFHPLIPGQPVEINQLQVSTVPVDHAIPCGATRIQDGSSSFVFSGDTGICDNLYSIAEGTDFFLCEASWLEKDKGPREIGHLTAKEAGQIAAQAQVKRLCLTHIFPEYDEAALLVEAQSEFSGEVTIAHQGATFQI